jgi:hypothetical protein
MRTDHCIALVALLAAGCGTAGPDSDPLAHERDESGDEAPGVSDLVEVEGDELHAACTLQPPRRALWATFRVVDETYRAAITNPQGIEQAIALWRGTSTATIPVAPLVCRQVNWNCPWKFYQDPAALTFADFAIEVCDGTPSYVSANCRDFGAGSYCPWSAELVDLRDCRYSLRCPRVPR